MNSFLRDHERVRPARLRQALSWVTEVVYPVLSRRVATPGRHVKRPGHEAADQRVSDRRARGLVPNMNPWSGHELHSLGGSVPAQPTGPEQEGHAGPARQDAPFLSGEAIPNLLWARQGLQLQGDTLRQSSITPLCLQGPASINGRPLLPVNRKT